LRSVQRLVVSFLSAAAHAYILLRFDEYEANIKKGINPARWYEYAISSSVMICLIAMLFGCYDFASLILIFFVNAVKHGGTADGKNEPSEPRYN